MSRPHSWHRREASRGFWALLPISARTGAPTYIFTYSLPLHVTATPLTAINSHPNGEVILLSLSLLLVGDPELYLRNKIMNALRLVAADESDAAKAFFSVVYGQHQQWESFSQRFSHSMGRQKCGRLSLSPTCTKKIRHLLGIILT